MTTADHGVAGSYQWPCGAWPSPISSAMVAVGGTRLGGPSIVGGSSGQSVWWLEGRPTEAGRSVLVSQSLSGDSTVTAELSQPWSARSGAHEYGGGAFWSGVDGVYFTEWSDQRIYRLAVNADGGLNPAVEPEPVTPAPELERGWRYADGRQHRQHRYLVCVREDHHGREGEPANELVAVAADGSGQSQILVTGPDFVSTPRISPDGQWLSWIQWDHPNMPWNETALCVASLEDGTSGLPNLGPAHVVADGEAIHGADWTADGRLIYSTDRTGFWNLAFWHPSGESEMLTTLSEAEIGLPSWNFGTQRWTELNDGRLVVAVTAEATDSLAVLDASGLHTIAEDLGQMTVVGFAAAGSLLTATIAQSNRLPEIIIIDPAADVAGAPNRHVVRPADEVAVESHWLSEPTSVWFSSGGRPTQCFFYPPSPVGSDAGGHDGDPRRNGGERELPPLIVMGHGGPTSHSGPDLHLRVQFWTSRGFAVADVNYGGSSGFGKAYRDRLDDRWGVLDVEDCVAAAQHLGADGLVDETRMAIRGGSAGGLTVMNALITSDVFQAGTSLYGVADLAALAADTHKFEARYLDRLVGPYPEAAEIYTARSPIAQADRLSTPMLVLQGSEDAVVPPQQSREIVAALAERNVAHAYIEFEGEQHGFRQGDNIIRALEAELWFYGAVFGFAPADQIDPPEHRLGLEPGNASPRDHR